MPLDAVTSPFLIRGHRSEVRAVTAGQRDTLRRCIAAMDPALAAYEGFAGHEARIGALLA